MPITAVNSATNATTKAVQQPKPREAEARKPDPARSTDESAKARQAQQQQAQKPEPAKPVVNAEGQKTGQVINVTA